MENWVEILWKWLQFLSIILESRASIEMKGLAPFSRPRLLLWAKLGQSSWHELSCFATRRFGLAAKRLRNHLVLSIA
jgi:hypothetical protein